MHHAGLLGPMGPCGPFKEEDMHIPLNDIRSQILGNVSITLMVDEAQARGHDIRVLEVEELSEGIKLTLAKWLLRGAFGIVALYKGKHFVLSAALKGTSVAVAAITPDGYVGPIQTQLSVELSELLAPRKKLVSRLGMLLDPQRATRTLDIPKSGLN